MHTKSLHDLLLLIASRIYLVCHWNQFRIFLTNDYLKSVQDNLPPGKKDCCEVLWTDRAGKSSGMSEHPLNQAEIISYLTQEQAHPSVYYLSALHMDERQFGIAALSFGKLPCCYQPEYCTLISYFCLAFDQLEEKMKLMPQHEDGGKAPENPQLYRQLLLIREEMQQHPEADWNVQKLCERTHVSRSYLQRMYKCYFGKSIFGELIDFRLQKARELLSSTEYPISQIAELCGYETYAHFAKQFKAQVGVTPSAFRKTRM